MPNKKPKKSDPNGYIRKARYEASNRSTSSPKRGKTWFMDSEWDVYYTDDPLGMGSKVSHQKFTPQQTLRDKMAKRKPKRAR